MGLNRRTEGSSLVAVTSLLSGTVSVVSGCLRLMVTKVSRQGAGFPALIHYAGHGGISNCIPCVLLVCAASVKTPASCEHTAESTKYFAETLQVLWWRRRTVCHPKLISSQGPKIRSCWQDLARNLVFYKYCVRLNILIWISIQHGVTNGSECCRG